MPNTNLKNNLLHFGSHTETMAYSWSIANSEPSRP